MTRRIETIIAIAAAVILITIVTLCIDIGDTAAQRDAAVAEAADLRAQLAEATEQKVLVVEPPADMTAVNEAYTPAAEPTVQTDYVKADELLGMKRIGDFTVTHYCTCSTCCGKSDGVTASGRQAVPYYSIAVDTSVIPLGTVVYIDYGDGVLHEARADDTGGAVVGYKLDLCVGDHQTAVQYGVRTATVYVGGRKE